MQNIIFTQLSASDLRKLIREEMVKVWQQTVDQNSNKPSAIEKFLSVSETADFLKLSRSTIYRLVHERAIPFMNKGKRLYFSQLELTDWLNSGRKNTTESIRKKADEFYRNQNENS